MIDWIDQHSDRGDRAGRASSRSPTLKAGDVDDVWTLFQRLPEGDRTFVKQPVTDLGSVRRWLGDKRSARSVARLGSRIVGYVALSPGTGWSRHVGELRLVVDPEVRRRGLGQRLARHRLRIALDAGFTKVVVEVVAEQESTIALFTRLVRARGAAHRPRAGPRGASTRI